MSDTEKTIEATQEGISEDIALISPYPQEAQPEAPANLSCIAEPDATYPEHDKLTDRVDEDVTLLVGFAEYLGNKGIHLAEFTKAPGKNSNSKLDFFKSEPVESLILGYLNIDYKKILEERKRMQAAIRRTS